MKPSSILLILAFISIVASLSFLYVAEITIQEVDCYDGEGSKILDLKCEKEVKEDQRISIWFIWLAFISMIGSIIVGRFERWKD